MDRSDQQQGQQHCSHHVVALQLLVFSSVTERCV